MIDFVLKAGVAIMKEHFSVCHTLPTWKMGPNTNIALFMRRHTKNNVMAKKYLKWNLAKSYIDDDVA